MSNSGPFIIIGKFTTMSGKPKNAELPIYLMIDKVLIGYISAISNTTPEMIMVNLRDMANIAIERLQNKHYGRRAWCNLKYPGVGFTIRAKCFAGHNWELRRKHDREMLAKFSADTGFTRPKNKKEWREAQFDYWTEFKSWINDNNIYKDYNYQSLIVEFVISGSTEYILMSQDEVDTAMVESILLVGEEDNDASE